MPAFQPHLRFSNGVLKQLEQFYAGAEHPKWEIFLAYEAPEGKRPGQERLAEQYGLASRDAVKAILKKLKKHFERLLRAELREEGIPEEEMDQEIAELRRLLGRPDEVA